MSEPGLGSALRRRLAPWLRAIGLGAALGAGIAGAERAGLWSGLWALGTRTSPLSLAMLALALRAAWLFGRALRTRLESRATGRPVRPELATIAKIFPVVGVLGSLWQLDRALSALDDAFTLARLPELWSVGLPALLGLGLQIATRRLAVHTPVWSLVRVTCSGEHEIFRLDHHLLGEDEPGLHALLHALDTHRPEALHLDLDPLLSPERCSALHGHIASHVDGPVVLAPPLPGMLDPRWSEVLSGLVSASPQRREVT